MTVKPGFTNTNFEYFNFAIPKVNLYSTTQKNELRARLCLSRIVLMCLLLFLNGCAWINSKAESHDVQSLDTQTIANGKSWWYYRVKIHWPEDDSPNWSLGALIASEIVSPVMTTYIDQIDLWRFHRRAAKDKAGHQFSFIFYSDATVARSMYTDLKHHPLVNELIDKGVVDRVGYDDIGQLIRPNIEDTSDKHWPLEIQQSWPHYIMGVSQMWLSLVNSLAQSSQELDTLKRFETVHEELTALWVNNGQHAWLHHLNALYAYEPFLIRY